MVVSMEWWLEWISIELLLGNYALFLKMQVLIEVLHCIGVDKRFV